MEDRTRKIMAEDLGQITDGLKKFVAASAHYLQPKLRERLIENMVELGNIREFVRAGVEVPEE